jgi:hypothetical protein
MLGGLSESLLASLKFVSSMKEWTFKPMLSCHWITLRASTAILKIYKVAKAIVPNLAIILTI